MADTEPKGRAELAAELEALRAQHAAMLAELRKIALWSWPDTGKGSRIHKAAWRGVEAATGETFQR